MNTSKKKKNTTESPELAKLKSQLAQANEARLRLAADYANLEKRVHEERNAHRDSATTSLLKTISDYG